MMKELRKCFISIRKCGPGDMNIGLAAAMNRHVKNIEEEDKMGSVSHKHTL